MLRHDVMVNGHLVPADMECYCVSRHVPSYAHPLPYFLPDGVVLYLCPTMYHGATTLYGLYKRLDGEPSRQERNVFSIVAQRLARMHWRMTSEGLTSQEIVAQEKLHRLFKKD